MVARVCVCVRRVRVCMHKRVCVWGRGLKWGEGVRFGVRGLAT